MGYYNDSDSDDYVNLACVPQVLSSEEEQKIKAEVEAEVEELRSQLENQVSRFEREVSVDKASYEDKLHKEVCFVAFHRDEEWRSLQEQGYVDREFSAVWLGYWAEFRVAEDVRRILRLTGDFPVKAWVLRLLEKVEKMPAFSSKKEGILKLEALASSDRADIEKRCRQYRDSRLSYHGIR